MDNAYVLVKAYGYNIAELNGLLITLFERYSELLLRKFSADFDQVSLITSFYPSHLTSNGPQIVSDDDNQPMMVNDHGEFEQVAGVCWLAKGEAESLTT